VAQRALELQVANTDNIRRAFCLEVVSTLADLRTERVGRIARHYAAVRQATIEAQLIRNAFVRETGNDAALPCMVFAGVRAPYLNERSAFDFWLDDMRRAGYDV
jgi:hypothetical protein